MMHDSSAEIRAAITLLDRMIVRREEALDTLLSTRDEKLKSNSAYVQNNLNAMSQHRVAIRALRRARRLLVRKSDEASREQSRSGIVSSDPTAGLDPNRRPGLREEDQAEMLILGSLIPDIDEALITIEALIERCRQAWEAQLKKPRARAILKSRQEALAALMRAKRILLGFKDCSLQSE
jgi:hypothetical protein